MFIKLRGNHAILKTCTFFRVNFETISNIKFLICYLSIYYKNVVYRLNRDRIDKYIQNAFFQSSPSNFAVIYLLSDPFLIVRPLKHEILL